MWRLGPGVLEFQSWQDFAARRGYQALEPHVETELQEIYRLAVTTIPARPTPPRKHD